jgi:tRNA pseudouridine38-40 synthase
MRLALGLQYDGSAFSGWQTQPNGQTVQDHLENALYQFMGDPQLPPVKTTTAGRTDTGVHALGQVVHFDTDIVRPDASWVRGVNSFLPKSISVQWVKPISADFDARYLAFERTYCYALFTGPQSAPLLTGRAGFLLLPKDEHLNIAAMQEAAKCLIGEHDFSSFRSSECQSKSPIKTIYQIDIHQDGLWVYFVFRGSAFLHHMVRNLVGSLLAVGQDKEPAIWLKQVLEARSRPVAAPTFMADGLYLVRVGYPEHFQIPEPQVAASLLPTSFFTSYKKVI